MKCLVLYVLGIGVGATMAFPASAAVSRAQCRVACADQIALCRTQATSARARRRCKPTWIKMCRSTGLAACEPTTTTSTLPPTVTTTLPSGGSTTSTTVTMTSTTTTTTSPLVTPAWTVNGSWAVTLSGFGGTTENCTATFQQSNCRASTIAGWVLCDLSGTSQDCAFSVSGAVQGPQDDPPNPTPNDVRAYFAFSGPLSAPAYFPSCVTLETNPNNGGFTGQAVGYSGFDPHYAAALSAPAYCLSATGYASQGNFGASWSQP